MLTPAQTATVKADILANADMNTQPANSDGSYAIANLYNLPATVPIAIWRTDASVDAIFDAIDWAKYTPVDAPDVTILQTNRLLSIQTKQMNLQNMLVGRGSVDATRANVRSGLRDATTAIPAGASGTAVQPGGASGATVLNACTRSNITRLEKLLASAPVTTGTVSASVLTFSGTISYQEIDVVRSS